jgi:hypothetical protein
MEIETVEIMNYKCNNQEFQNGAKTEPCLNTWNGDHWNKNVDTEYTRNEKCPRCGSKDVEKIATN